MSNMIINPVLFAYFNVSCDSNVLWDSWPFKIELSAPYDLTD